MVKIIFLIDDDQDDREMFEEAVRTCDPEIEVLEASDGVEALQILNANETRPDVIFLDYNMPRMNGVQCLQRLKTNTSTRDIPVVMYTTSGNRAHEESTLLLGADFYMQKTNSFKQLCVELERLLSLITCKLEERGNFPDRDLESSSHYSN